LVFSLKYFFDDFLKVQQKVTGDILKQCLICQPLQNRPSRPNLMLQKLLISFLNVLSS